MGHFYYFSSRDQTTISQDKIYFNFLFIQEGSSKGFLEYIVIKELKSNLNVS